MTNRMFIDIHVLQTVPPSNINRDDTGAPKTAVYGGARRARVSSQAWKRATRVAFQDEFDSSELGVRTTRVVTALADRIRQTDSSISEAEASKVAEVALKAVGLKVDVKPRKSAADDASEANPRSGYLVFLSDLQLSSLAELAIASHHSGNKIDVRAAKHAASTKNSIDVALFGRMVADDSNLNVDAAAQVAHAISIHKVDNEYDYFTAVDDLNTDDAGAGMIGTVEFNSSTLYRYATVNVPGLLANLGDVEATARAAGAFVRCFTSCMPTGKQNTFANRTLPDAVIVMVRTQQPINLVGAFESPVADSADRLKTACEKLATHARDTDEAYGYTPVRTLVVHVGERTAALGELGDAVSFRDLGNAVEELVRDQMGS